MHGERKNQAFEQSENINRLQREIETGQRDPKRNSVFQVSCSLLQSGGWGQAWEWNKKIWGDDFDPSITYSELKGIVDSYPEQYRHVEIPSPPS